MLGAGEAETLFAKRAFRLHPHPPLHLPKTCFYGDWYRSRDIPCSEEPAGEAFRECEVLKVFFAPGIRDDSRQRNLPEKKVHPDSGAWFQGRLMGQRGGFCSVGLGRMSAAYD